MDVRSVIIALLVIIITVNAINIGTAATVELISPQSLPVKLNEGEQVSINIKIKDFEDAKQITLDTSLVSDGKPIYDFGDLNPYINENKYQPKIILNISTLPQKAFLDVTISGKAPEGEKRIKIDNSDIIFSKFENTKLKLYEVSADEKLADIESSELVIAKKENFEKTIQQIRRKEFDNIKTDVQKLFDLGLTTEAQNIATDMSNIKWPDSLTLFGIMKIESDIWIDVIVIGVLIVGFFIGYGLGSRRPDDDEMG